MITDCEHGKIDFIITRSISRFARNVTDCLELVRKLLGSLAENESISISENEKWSIRKPFQNGTYVISYSSYGYTNVDGEMVIVPDQAENVKEILLRFW